MADFCKDCSIEIWGEDTGDLAGLSTEEMTKQGLYISALCEGCGPIIVDHTGKKIDTRITAKKGQT